MRPPKSVRLLSRLLLHGANDPPKRGQYIVPTPVLDLTICLRGDSGKHCYGQTNPVTQRAPIVPLALTDAILFSPSSPLSNEKPPEGSQCRMEGMDSSWRVNDSNLQLIRACGNCRCLMVKQRWLSIKPPSVG